VTLTLLTVNNKTHRCVMRFRVCRHRPPHRSDAAESRETTHGSSSEETRKNKRPQVCAPRPFQGPFVEVNGCLDRNFNFLRRRYQPTRKFSPISNHKV
jgi:hypothetical protein